MLISALALFAHLNITLGQADSKPIPFFKSLRAFDVAAIKAEAKQHDVNNLFFQGSSAFHMLAIVFPRTKEAGNEAPTASQTDKIVQALLEIGANPNDTNNIGETPLHVAARKDTHSVIITAMIKSGADPNLKQAKSGFQSSTPLLVAIDTNHIQAARALIEGGADVQMRGGLREAFPLSVAAWRGNLPFVKLLVEKGAKVNAVKEDGQTALHAAALTNKKENAAVIQYLLAKGANRSAKTKDGETALDLAKRKKFNLIIQALRR